MDDSIFNRPVSFPAPIRRQIDVGQLANTLAAPEVAAQRAKISGYEQLAQLPERLVGLYGQSQQLKLQNQELAPFEQASPGLFKMFKSNGIDFTGAPFHLIKPVLPAVIELMKEKAKSGDTTPLFWNLDQNKLEAGTPPIPTQPPPETVGSMGFPGSLSLPTQQLERPMPTPERRVKMTEGQGRLMLEQQKMNTEKPPKTTTRNVSSPDGKIYAVTIDNATGALISRVEVGGMSPKPIRVTSETMKLKANTMSGIRAIETAQQILEKNPDLFRKASLGRIATLGDTQAQKLNLAINEASDVVTRLRTGAALNKDEQTFYNNVLAPTYTDTEETAKEKLAKRKEFFNSIISQIEAGTRIPGQPGGEPNFVGTEPLISELTTPSPARGSLKTKTGIPYSIE